MNDDVVERMIGREEQILSRAVKPFYSTVIYHLMNWGLITSRAVLSNGISLNWNYSVLSKNKFLNDYDLDKDYHKEYEVLRTLLQNDWTSYL